jgi:hypothetical protein
MCTFHEQSMPINVVFLVFECLCFACLLNSLVILCFFYATIISLEPTTTPLENTDIIQNILTIHTDTIHHSYRCQLVLFFFRISSHEGKIVEAHVTTMQLNYAMEIAFSLKL